MGARIHPTAIIEQDVEIGAGTSVWDTAHIRRGVKIGQNCIIGEKAYIAYDVQIGNFVKINSSVYICAGVTVEDFCMISAHTVFTNDVFPRAGNVELTGLETSDPTSETLRTLVHRGATIGANSTIGPGLTLGEYCMVGMGSVVTNNVRPHELVTGNPAKCHAWVCVCGRIVLRNGEFVQEDAASCYRCGREYAVGPSGIMLVTERLGQQELPT